MDDLGNNIRRIRHLPLGTVALRVAVGKCQTDTRLVAVVGAGDARYETWISTASHGPISADYLWTDVVVYNPSPWLGESTR
jgi:hypothetical protein